MDKYCPKCQIKRPNANFCWMCGSELTTTPPLTCVKCDYILDPADRFCPSCGNKVK